MMIIARNAICETNLYPPAYLEQNEIYEYNLAQWTIFQYEISVKNRRTPLYFRTDYIDPKT